MALALLLGGALHSTAAQEKIVASVNGKQITDADLELAAIDLGPEVAKLPDDQRRRLLLEAVIETQLLADAAEKVGLNATKEFQQRLGFVRRKLLRDEYFANRVLPLVTDADAKKVYDEQREAITLEEETRVLHILVQTESEADELRARIAGGADFRKLAQQFSKDTGSNWNGGDLGFVTKGGIAEEFEPVVLSLPKGSVSSPLKTKFGWHLFLIEDKRARAVPNYEAVKADLASLLAQRKAQEVVAELLGKAKIDVVDPALKATLPEPVRNAPPKAAPVAKAKAAPSVQSPSSGEWTKDVFGR